MFISQFTALQIEEITGAIKALSQSANWSYLSPPMDKYNYTTLHQQIPVVKKFIGVQDNATWILSEESGNFNLEVKFNDEPYTLYNLPEVLLNDTNIHQALKMLHQTILLSLKHRLESRISSL